MKTDAYIKIMLTVIAGALLLLVARSFQNPPVVTAQGSGPQHVIVDDFGPFFGDVPSPLRKHLPVIIDGIGPDLRAMGLPVSYSGISGLHGWEYSASDCTLTTLNAKGLLGWELVATTESPGHAFTYNPKTGRGEISGLILEEENNKTPAQYALCYFKKQQGR